MANTTPEARWRTLIAPGLDAVRHNWRPFVIIQVAAVLVVASYYFSPAVQAALKHLGAFKDHSGLVFSALSTVFAGMVLPELARRFSMRVKSETSDLCFQIFFFSIIGVTVDLFYRWMAGLFGTGTDTATVAKKVLIDQIFFTPLGTAVLSVVLFTWRDEKFSIGVAAAKLKNGEFARRYPNIAITSWAFWIPVLIAVYALPANLQFMLFLCAQAAWSLLLVHMSKAKA